MKFAKFLKISFSQNTSGRLLLANQDEACKPTHIKTISNHGRIIQDE